MNQRAARLQDLLMGGKVFHQTNCAAAANAGSVAEVQFDLLHRDGSRPPMLLNISGGATVGNCWTKWRFSWLPTGALRMREPLARRRLRPPRSVMPRQ
jgi:hypothetical protein